MDAEIVITKPPMDTSYEIEFESEGSFVYDIPFLY